jgi:hypothetical protein
MYKNTHTISLLPTWYIINPCSYGSMVLIDELYSEIVDGESFKYTRGSLLEGIAFSST